MTKNPLFLMPLALGVSTAIAAEISVPVISIFKTPALVEIQFTADNQFSTEEIYHIEEATSLYLKELLTNDDSLRFLDEPDSVIDVSVNVQVQDVEGSEIILGSNIDVIHYGDVGITDVAALLTFLVNRNNTDSSFIYLDHLIKTDAAIELISFDYVSESIAMATNLTTTSAFYELETLRKNGSEKTLLVVTTILSITLFGISAILIWVGGGWLVLRKKVRELVLREEELTRMTMNIESKPTAETEEGDDEDRHSPSTNPSGILGVNNNPYTNRQSIRGSRPNIYGLGVKTPGKVGGNMSIDDLATPMSVMSDYSDTDRAPIGIMSMRKLVPPPQDDDDDENNNQNTSDDFNSMKKLEY